MRAIITERESGKPSKAQSADGRYSWDSHNDGYVYDHVKARAIYQMHYVNKTGEGFGERPVPQDVQKDVLEFYENLNQEIMQADLLINMIEILDESAEINSESVYSPEIRGEERERRIRNYNSVVNEGKEGFNPWRDSPLEPERILTKVSKFARDIAEELWKIPEREFLEEHDERLLRGIETRQETFDDIVAEIKKKILAALKNNCEALKDDFELYFAEANRPEPMAIPVKIAQFWAKIDASDFQEIWNKDCRESAALEIAAAMRKNADYAEILETQFPKVAQAAKQADAELDRAIYEKEIRKAEEFKLMTRSDPFDTSDTWWVADAWDENLQYIPTNDKDHYVWNPKSVYFRTLEKLEEVMECSKEDGEISRWFAEAIPAHFGYYVLENKAGNYQAEVRDGRGFTVYKINEGLSLGNGETSLVQMDILNENYEVDYLRLARYLEVNRLPWGSKIYEGNEFDHICQEFREKHRKIEAEDESPEIP